MIGGSGGGGGGAVTGNHGGSGGGGGGAILIASSGTITTASTMAINAAGGVGAQGVAGGAGGGGGTGGAVRLVANTITGSGTIDVSGGERGGSNLGVDGGKGGSGFVRAEAFSLTGFNPTVPTNSMSLALPNPASVPNGPSLRIAAVAGVAAPASPVGSLSGSPDIVLPSSQANPATVAIESTNVPVGTVIQVTLIPTTGARVSAQSSPLAGTLAASSATASINLPSGVSVLTATAVIDLSQAIAQPVFMHGERVNKIEVAAAFGGASEVTYITQSGRRIKKVE